MTTARLHNHFLNEQSSRKISTFAFLWWGHWGLSHVSGNSVRVTSWPEAMNDAIERPCAFTMHSLYAIFAMDLTLSCSKVVQTLQEISVLGPWNTLGTYHMWWILPSTVPQKNLDDFLRSEFKSCLRRWPFAASVLLFFFLILQLFTCEGWDQRTCKRHQTYVCFSAIYCFYSLSVLALGRLVSSSAMCVCCPTREPFDLWTSCLIISWCFALFSVAILGY